MDKFIIFIVSMIVGIPLALLRGLVLRDLTDWFTPFHIGIVQWIGISYIIALFIAHLPTSFDDEKDMATKMVNMQVFNVLLSLMFWGIGYLWSLFL